MLASFDVKGLAMLASNSDKLIPAWAVFNAPQSFAPSKKKKQEITFFSSKNNNGEKIPARLDFNKFQFKFRTKTFSNPKIEVEAETERV